MLHKVAELCASKLYQSCSLEEAKRPVYVYGFELFLSSISSITSILILSACLSIVPSAIIFLSIFCSLRLFSGGYHAQTYNRCFVLTNVVYFVTIGCVALLEIALPNYALLVISISLHLFSAITILLFAPIRNKHHPLSQNRYLQNRKIACILSVIFMIIGTVVLWSGREHGYILISFTVTAVAVMMIVPKIQERRA